VAISNDRLLDIADGNVTFRYKDYRHGAGNQAAASFAASLLRLHFKQCCGLCGQAPPRYPFAITTPH